MSNDLLREAFKAVLRSSGDLGKKFDDLDRKSDEAETEVHQIIEKLEREIETLKAQLND